MKRIILLIAFLFSGYLGIAQEKEIRALLEKQRSGWNEGDITAYMQGYWNSDFITSTQSIDLNIQARSLNILLDESLEQLSKELNQNNITLNKNFNQTDLFVDVDYDKMVNTFYHIVENAIAAKSSKITIEVIYENESAVVCIKDNGEGIDTQNQEKIFEPFFTTKQKNMGLGLTNAQKNILNHRGKLLVESAKNEGTTFKIILPISNQSTLWD